MPYPASYIPFGTPISPKQLNQDLYEDDGTITGVPGAPTGIQFLARRPLLLESMLYFGGEFIPGEEEWPLYTYVNGLGTNTYNAYIDTAGVYGRGSDSPGGQAGYLWQPVVPVSSGTSSGSQFSGAGGWTVMCHFIPLTVLSTQVSAGAQIYLAPTTLGPVTVLSTGSWQASDTSRDNCTFCLDMIDAQPAAGNVVTPGVFVNDPSGLVGPALNDTDSSGETPRFLAFWAGASTWAATDVNPALPSPLTSWTPSSTADSALLNGSSGIADVINFLQYPPMFRSALSSSQQVTTGANVTMTLASTPSVDSFSGQNGTTGYTVQRDGLYLCHAVTCWGASSAGQRATGITVNGTLYWGPGYVAASSGIVMSTKTQVLSLRAGDTVSVTIRQNSGSPLTLSNQHQSRMFMTWLGNWTAPGSPQAGFTPPDPAFRWQAGTPGSALPGLLTEHLASDLGFLTCHPYFLGYQSTAQSGLPQDNFVPVTLNQQAGIVHGDNGDPWGGWSSSLDGWQAPVAGWYLVTGELYATAAPGTASVVAGLTVSTSGGFLPAQPVDYYQHQLASTNGALPPGGTITGCYYLLPGEYVVPQIMAQDYGTTFGTVHNTNANGGTVACHMEIVWLSE